MNINFLRNLGVLLMIPMAVEAANPLTSKVAWHHSHFTPQFTLVGMGQSKNTEPCAVPAIKLSIKVDISEQQLYLFCYYENGNRQVKIYPISTSKYGIGNQAGSNKTPLGLHRIENKIGDGAPLGMIFKARQSMRRIAKINQEVGDVITTRIMWLKGLEPGKNSGDGIDSYRRYIYIHGTADENKIGQPASHGCVRMYNRDVIDLFDRVTEGTLVYIKK